MSSIATWETIHALAEAACRHFKLPWPITLRPMTRRPRSSTCFWRFGECLTEHCTTCRCEPVLRLRLRGRNGRLLSRASLVAVLAHELAHLRHLRHNNAHAAFTIEIADWMRERGYNSAACMLVFERRAAKRVRR